MLFHNDESFFNTYCRIFVFIFRYFLGKFSGDKNLWNFIVYPKYDILELLNWPWGNITLTPLPGKQP